MIQCSRASQSPKYANAVEENGLRGILGSSRSYFDMSEKQEKFDIFRKRIDEADAFARIPEMF